MRFRHKKFVLLLIAVMAVVAGGVFVWAASPAQPTIADDRSPLEISNVTVQAANDEIELSASQSEQEFTLSLELLKDGGVRLYDKNACNPIFQEKLADLKDETEIDQSNKTLTITGKTSGVKVVLDYDNSEEWSLNVYKEAQTPVYSIDSTQLLIQYNGAKRTSVSLQGDIADGEQFIGLGERYTGTILNGNTYPMWNEDSWSGGLNGDKTSSYANVPLLHSSNGYSVFFNSYNSGSADIGDTDSGKYELEFAGEDLDVFLWTGTPLENLKSYMAVTGTTVTIPKWAVGYWAGGNSNNYWDGIAQKLYDADEAREETATVADYYGGALEEILEKYNDMGTLPAAIFAESMPTRKIADTSSASAQYGVELLGWYHADAPWSSDKNQLINAEYLTNYYSSIVDSANLPLVKTSDETYYTYEQGGTWNVMDYSHEDASELVSAFLQRGFDNDLSGLMVDFGEYIEADTLFANGMTGTEMHNLQAYYYNKAMQTAWENSEKQDDYILFARAGSAGSQSFAAQFGGDQRCNFEGLRQAVMGGLSASASGFGIWGSDIGGLGNGGNDPDTDPTLTAELYLRWLGYGTFSTLMRTHGSMDHDPWTFSDEVETEGLSVNVEDVFKKYYWTRENLADAIYSATLQSHKDGTPVMQVMGLAYPDYFSVGDQYMFCNDMLVAPIYEAADSGQAGTVTKSVTFPEGIWYDLWTGDTIMGTGAAQDITVKVDETPVYLRSGSVMPVDLSATYELAADMNSGSVQAILVTPMEEGESRTSTWYIGEDKNAPAFTYKSISVDGSYSILAKQTEENPKVILGYGIATEKAYVDGKELTRLTNKPTGSETGYYVDETSQEIIVVLGNDNWEQITFQDTEMVKSVTYTAEQFAEYRKLSGFTSPALDGYLFAGWFYDELGTKSVSEKITTTTGSVYAKFIPENVLKVKAQVSANLLDAETDNDASASIRFVTSIDTLNYAKIGFEVSYDKGDGKQTEICASNEVYTKLFAEVGNADGETIEYDPIEFSSISTYFKACTVEGINEAFYSMEFKVRPYWITADGTQVYASVERSMSVNSIKTGE